MEIRPSRTGLMEQVFVGEGHFDLHLRIAELRDLQEKCNAGPARIRARLLEGDWLVDDVIQTIRLALIGGGLPKREAFDLVERHVVSGENLLSFAALAYHCVTSALVGPVEEPIAGEPEAVETPQTPTEES